MKATEMSSKTPHKALNFAAIIAVLPHILCCGLPALVSLLSLGSAFGVLTANTALHASLHIYEGHFVIFSLVILLFGWVLNWKSKQLNCQTDGHCHHSEPAHTVKKKNTHRILQVATALTVVNILFLLFERF